MGRAGVMTGKTNGVSKRMKDDTMNLYSLVSEYMPKHSLSARRKFSWLFFPQCYQDRL